jgi:hypothetical protein
MSSPATLHDDAVIAHPNDNDAVVVHSPAIVRGKRLTWTTRTIDSHWDWKCKMQRYVESLFEQLVWYDSESLNLVVEKYFRVISGTGIPHRFANTNKRYANALQEIQKLIAPVGPVCQNNFVRSEVCPHALMVLDRYAHTKRYEDFEEIAFVLTIIINSPIIVRGETR